MAWAWTASRTPIDEQWLAAVSDPDELATFVNSARPWEHEPIPLPRRVTAALWCIAGVNVLVGCWATAVLSEFWPCSGLACSLTTLGNRPGLLLTLTSICFLTTAGTAPLTRGLTRANGWQLGVLAPTAIVGIGCLLGPLLILMVVVIAVAVACLSLLFLVERL